MVMGTSSRQEKAITLFLWKSFEKFFSLWGSGCTAPQFPRNCTPGPASLCGKVCALKFCLAPGLGEAPRVRLPPGLGRHGGVRGRAGLRRGSGSPACPPPGASTAPCPGPRAAGHAAHMRPSLGSRPALRVSPSLWFDSTQEYVCSLSLFLL